MEHTTILAYIHMLILHAISNALNVWIMSDIYFQSILFCLNVSYFLSRAVHGNPKPVNIPFFVSGPGIACSKLYGNADQLNNFMH